MQPCDVSAKTVHRGKEAPPSFANLGRVEDRDYRIYLLKCKPQIVGGPFSWYAGCEHKSEIVKRLRKQFNGLGADYTQQYEPLSIDLIMPCPTRAAEAYLFYAVMEARPLAAVVAGRLGGWTQTRPKPSETCKLMLQDSWRMLKGVCLCCGGNDGHVTKTCPNKAKVATAALMCGHCMATLHVTAVGNVSTRPPSGASASVAAAATPAVARGANKRGNSMMVASDPEPKRRAVAEAAAPLPRPVATERKPFPQVLVVGHKYSTLEWFLGRGSTPKERREALDHCGKHAVELQGGEHSTLLRRGWAKAPPLHPKELLPDRHNFPVSEFKETACLALRHPYKPVKIKLQPDAHRLKGFLLRVEDLRQCAQKYRWES